ncbi:MAG: lysylphosphatidylglycerol synthase transmembrane domain-containing protein [Bacteroidota bacterium]
MKSILNWLRVLLFFPLLYFLFREVRFQQIQVALQHVDWWLLLLAFFLYSLKYTLQGLRWYNAALAHGLHYPVLFFVKTQFEIAFLEMLLPIPDSEDALRIIKLRGQSVNVANSVAVTLFDRVMGVLFILMLLPFTGWLMAAILFKHIKISYIGIVIGFIPLFLFALNYRKIIAFMLALIERFTELNHSFFENLKLSMVQKIELRYRLYGLLGTITFGLAGAFCIWLLVHSLGAKVSFISLLLCIPFFQGLGLYESTLVFVLQQMGIGNEIAVVAGTLHFLFHVIIILAGGGVFMTNPLKTDISLPNFITKRL